MCGTVQINAYSMCGTVQIECTVPAVSSKPNLGTQWLFMCTAQVTVPVTTACCHAYRLNTSKQLLGQFFLRHASEVSRQRNSGMCHCGADWWSCVSEGLSLTSLSLCGWLWQACVIVELSLRGVCHWGACMHEIFGCSLFFLCGTFVDGNSLFLIRRQPP